MKKPVRRPSGDKAAPISVAVNLDGRKIAEAMIGHLARRAEI
jgi:hypothetical protein